MPRRFGSLARFLSLTAAPATPGAGDVWFRSDTGQFRGSDGQTGEQLTLGPEGNVPVIRSTAWHNYGYGNAAALSIAEGRLFALPFWPGRSCTLTGVAANVTTLLLASSLRMGIYLSDGVLPTTLLADYGTVTSASTGIRSITGLTTSVRPVLHYLAIVRQDGALGTLAVSSRSSWDPIVSDASPTIAANTNAYFRDSVAGALPATFGAPAGTDQGPCLVVQLS